MSIEMNESAAISFLKKKGFNIMKNQTKKPGITWVVNTRKTSARAKHGQCAAIYTSKPRNRDGRHSSIFSIRLYPSMISQYSINTSDKFIIGTSDDMTTIYLASSEKGYIFHDSNKTGKSFELRTAVPDGYKSGAEKFYIEDSQVHKFDDIIAINLTGDQWDSLIKN